MITTESLTEMVKYELLIVNQHKRLQNFFAQSGLKIGLKPMVFRVSFSMHMGENQFKRCCPTV